MNIINSPLFIILLCLATFTLSSQNKYEYIFDLGYSDIAHDAIKIGERIFILGTQEEKLLTSPGSFLLVVIDAESGQVLQTNTFSDNTYQNLFGLSLSFSQSDSTLVLLGEFDGSPDNIGLIKTDLIGNEQWRVSYNIHDYLDNYKSVGSIKNYDVLSFSDSSNIIVFVGRPDIENEHIFQSRHIILAKFDGHGKHI